MTSKKTGAALAALAVAAGTLATAGTADAGQGTRHQPVAFQRAATYPVFQNRPAGEDAATETVAEISATSEDGRTLVYTDAAGKRIGFLDIGDPGRPRGLGTLSLTELGDAEDEPTSVTVVGQYVLVVVNTSASYSAPSGRVDIVSLRTRERVASHDLGGQPDSIALSKDKRYAAVAIENERDEEAAPAGAEEGDLPQAPAGFVHTVHGIDTVEDGVVDQTGSITDVPREPDAVGWIDDRYLATANEGDWRGGSRGWSVFDSRTGKVVWDAGNSFERLAVRHGLHTESRSEKKGTEPEGLAVGTYDGVRYAFVGSERSNFVAVYDMSDPAKPVFRQILPTTNGPEGLLPIPSRGLFAVSSETDDAEAGVRASVSLFELGKGAPAAPGLVSADDPDGAPIGWGALGALSAVPGDPRKLYSVTDAAYATTRVLTIDTSRRPAIITGELTVKDAEGKPTGYDAEGVHARPRGGYWLAVEGAKGAENKLVRLDRDGVTKQTVSLPADVAAGLGKQGFEGVTATTDRKGHEILWTVLQREVAGDPEGVARIGRYDTRTGTWSWYGYRLATTTADGDWIGLSEITVVGDELALVERDKLNGPAARIKRVHTVGLPAGAAPEGGLPVLRKSLALDVLPALKAGNGWTQEKLEGLTVGGNGEVYAVTDNDALDDATGETVLLDLGSAKKVFGRHS